MQKYSEQQFISRLPLRSLKKVQSGYVCNCFKCGGATPWKTKMYILTENKSFITVFCQKCGYNTNLKKFISDISPALYSEYLVEERKELMEDLKNGTLFRKPKSTKQVNTHAELKYTFKLGHYFKPAAEYTKAIDFCYRREIFDHINRLYYCVHPDNIMSGMVIFPFYLEDGKTLYGFQGRHTDTKLFYTHSKNESMKVFNIYNVNNKEVVYIFESIIDSLMVDNSIAMLGTSLSEEMKNRISQRVWIFDNDKVGKKRALEFFEKGEKCLVYPDNFHFKDLNEAVCAQKLKKENVQEFLINNTHNLLEGKTKLMFQLMSSKR